MIKFFYYCRGLWFIWRSTYGLRWHFHFQHTAFLGGYRTKEQREYYAALNPEEPSR